MWATLLRAKGRGRKGRNHAKEVTDMYPIYDPNLALEMHHQHAEELRREAAAHRLAREGRKARRRRLGGGHRASARPRPVLP
jgi:hypothetical protein